MRVKNNIKTMLTFQVTGPTDKGAACMLHNAMYEYANLNALDFHLGIEKGGLKSVVDAVKNLGLKGFYLGEPHKTDVIAYLDEVDPISRDLLCVNTVVNQNGKLYGIGLDGVGMGMAIEHDLASVKGKSVLIIGAGAVGGLIAADLCERGAKRIHIANRTKEKARNIAVTLQKYYNIPVSFSSLKEVEMYAKDTDLLVQCSSVGNAAHPELHFESLDYVDVLPKNCIVADVNYPVTELIERAEKNGLKTIAGESMMYFQQIEAMKTQFGVNLSDDCIQEGREAVAIAIALRAFNN